MLDNSSVLGYGQWQCKLHRSGISYCLSRPKIKRSSAEFYNEISTTGQHKQLLTSRVLFNRENSFINR